VQKVDAIVLSGGSAYGLDAASGVQAWLREQGRGFPVGDHRIPVVPSAILYDLGNGGNKSWGRYPPYRELGYEAATNLTQSPTMGSVGAGLGATVAGSRGGFGIASQQLRDDQSQDNQSQDNQSQTCVTVCSIAVCNAVGSVTISGTEHFWAAPFEKDAEFGGRGFPHPLPISADKIVTKGDTDIENPNNAESNRGQNTTLVVVMTNARLSQAECKRMAINAHDGFARAIYPVHTPVDGDIVFVLSSNEIDCQESGVQPLHLYTAAANTVTRAIARGVYEAGL
jgi:L-aminopeptidase/D-esterase-like protein